MGVCLEVGQLERRERVMDNFQVRVGRNIAWNGIDVYVFAKEPSAIDDSSKRWRLAESMNFVEKHPHESCGPTFRLSPIEGQSLIDELWCAGLRPTEGTGSAGSLAATQLHLKDLQEFHGRLLDKVLARKK